MNTVLKIPRKLWDFLLAFGKSTNMEVGAMCHINLDPETKHLEVTKIVPLKQVVTAGAVTLDSTAMADYSLNLWKTSPSELKSFCGWWHSHQNMGVSPSEQDLRQAEELCEGRDYIVWFITNHAEKVSAYYTQVEPVPFTVELDVEVVADDLDEKELLKALSLVNVKKSKSRTVKGKDKKPKTETYYEEISLMEEIAAQQKRREAIKPREQIVRCYAPEPPIWRGRQREEWPDNDSWQQQDPPPKPLHQMTQAEYEEWFWGRGVDPDSITDNDITGGHF